MSATPPPELLRNRSLIGAWRLDPHTSTVRLKTRTIWGIAPVKGTFREISGKGTVAPSGEVSGTLVVAAASLDTKNARRDKHLRSDDFFDSDHHPSITFEAINIQASGDGVAVTGTLTVRDRTLPLSFDAVVSVRGVSEVWLDAEIRVDRADFGLTWNGLGASTQNALSIHAGFTRS